VRRVAFALLIIFVLGASSAVAAADEIKDIVVEDNTKTTADTVILISQLSPGDNWTPDMVDVVKARLVSSGLFKDVEVYWTPVPGGVKVHILAKDKHSWVIAPAFYNQPTNVGGGVGFGENNLFGENQKLLLYGQVATGDSFFIGAWVVPSIAGTRLYSQLDTYLKSSRIIEYSAPRSYVVADGKDAIHEVRQSRQHYFNFGARLGVEIFRGVKLDARIRGAKVSYKDVIAHPDSMPGDFGPGVDPTNVPAPGDEGFDISNENNLTFDTRANWYGVQSGHKYRLTFEHALPSLGSDFIYWVASANAFRAIKIMDRHNFIAKADVGYGHNLPFQQELKSGGTSMRGYVNDEFRGNFRTLVNLEYSFPMLDIKGFSMRGLAFYDSAYTTFTKVSNPQRNYLPNSTVRGLDGFKNSVGVGTRFYLRQIVLPLLGLDFGYGLEARDFQIYLAIGLTD
jgi:outer membrane protein insertion porin family